MAAVCALGFIHGDPRRLVYPTDTRGNICGYGKYSDRPKLVFFDLLACSKMGHDAAKFGCPTPQMCVKECPTSNYVYMESVIKERKHKNMKIENERKKLICKYGVDRMAESITDLVKSGKCAAYYLKSISVARRCIPAVFNTKNFHDKLLSGNSSIALENSDGVKITPHSLDEATRYLSEFYKFHEYGEMIYSDVKGSWLLILVCLLIAVGISLFWVILLRWLASVLIWVTLITFLGLLGFKCVSLLTAGCSFIGNYARELQSLKLKKENESLMAHLSAQNKMINELQKENETLKAKVRIKRIFKTQVQTPYCRGDIKKI